MSTLISHQNKLFNHTFCQTYHIYEDKEIHFLLGDKAVFFSYLKVSFRISLAVSDARGGG